MKPRRRKQFIDENEPERVLEWLAKHPRRKARPVATRISARCWERMGCLGEPFYRAVAEKLLADAANFDGDYPTRAAMHKIKSIVADVLMDYLQEGAIREEDVFHREYLQQYYDIEIRPNLPNENDQ